jgi:hypothetical protein
MDQEGQAEGEMEVLLRHPAPIRVRFRWEERSPHCFLLDRAEGRRKCGRQSSKVSLGIEGSEASPQLDSPEKEASHTVAQPTLLTIHKRVSQDGALNSKTSAPSSRLAT